MDANLPLVFWTQVLRLPDFRIAHAAEDTIHQRLVFTLAPVHKIGLCPHCGRASETSKQRCTREGIHDLPIGPNQVELTVRVNQFACDHCGHAFTHPIPFVAEWRTPPNAFSNKPQNSSAAVT